MAYVQDRPCSVHSFAKPRKEKSMKTFDENKLELLINAFVENKFEILIFSMWIPATLIGMLVGNLVSGCFQFETTKLCYTQAIAAAAGFFATIVGVIAAIATFYVGAVITGIVWQVTHPSPPDSDY